MEKSMLTREQIESAKNDLSHPVVQTLLDMDSWVMKYKNDYEKIREEKDSQRIMCKKLLPFVERLNKLDDFSMAPLDIVSIWARVCDDFKEMVYARYNLASIIPTTYATRGINSEDWKEVGTFISNYNRGLPEIVTEDNKNNSYFWKRMVDVSKSNDELDFYMYGTRESFVDLARKAYKEGDAEAEKEFERVNLHYEEHKDEILSNIHENFGNGFSPLFVKMPNDLRSKFFGN